MQYSVFDTEWGSFGLVARGRRLVATFLPQPARGLRRAIADRYPGAVETPDLLPRFRRQVIDYFKGKPTRFSIDIDIVDVPTFRQDVLRACRRIPFGKTASYADLARAAGKPGAARAAGSAMANNPLPLVVPCHRVVRSDGSLGGFSTPQGVRQKKRMLCLEDAL